MGRGAYLQLPVLQARRGVTLEKAHHRVEMLPRRCLVVMVARKYRMSQMHLFFAMNSGGHASMYNRLWVRWAVASVAAAVSAGVVMTTVPAGAVTAVRSTRATVNWSGCADPFLQSVGAECGFVSVPLDYDRPDGQTVRLAVSRVRHTVPEFQYQGVMLVNPGGPGNPGLEMSMLGSSVPNGVGGAYDWIGFDPRGVGSSEPALSCIPDYFQGNRPDYIPRTPALEQVWVDRSRAYATACGVNGGELLRHMTTVDVAKDLDRIRVALGRQQINYYGFSYGTYLAQVYSTLFPSRVRRMVLDSNVDPRKVWHHALLARYPTADSNVAAWFGWVARYDSVYHLGATGTDVKQRWYAEQAALRNNPAGAVVGPDEWADVFLISAFVQAAWPDLANAFAGWVHDRDAAAVVDLYQAWDTPGDDNGMAVGMAILCTDAPWPTWETWRHGYWNTYRNAPFSTWSLAWSIAPCMFWPAPATTPMNIDGSGVANALLVGETLDAATPFEGSIEVRRRFPNARLLAEPGGTSHAATLFGNSCVDNKIADYLATGALPPRVAGDGPDAYCAPLPQPVPYNAAPTTSGSTEQSGAVNDRLRLVSERLIRPLG
jgi:pimeloyl-ACP methyl ester carboxylesterase